MNLVKKYLCYFIKLSILLPQLVLANVNLVSTSVPFQNIILNPNDVIKATYSFGDHAIIFCYENNQKFVGNVQWTFQGQIKNSTLSVFLKVNPNFQGEFADPNGIILVTNTTNHTLIVSCPYGF